MGYDMNTSRGMQAQVIQANPKPLRAVESISMLRERQAVHPEGKRGFPRKEG
jgi:hypothetical protein